jgi:Collagen triple helix repeat (20 copies)
MSWILRYIRSHHIALLALFLALGGTSLAAANLISGKQIKPHTIPQNRLTNGAINALRGSKGAKGAPGARGATGTKGATGAGGVKGDKGDTGAPGTAVAYAHVNLDGTLDAANSKNLLSSRYDYGGPGACRGHALHEPRPIHSSPPS